MGVSYLVDTHVLLWLLGSPERLPQQAHDLLADPRNQLLVSAASALEVATETRLGKLEPLGLVESWQRRLGDIDAVEVPVTGAHAVLAGSMPWAHRDPFDRILVAQAIEESAVLVTHDRVLLDLPAPRMLEV